MDCTACGAPAKPGQRFCTSCGAALVLACRTCGALTEQQPCSICDDPRRDSSLVCLVEQPVDIFSIEKSRAYHGKYHVLGGKISPLNGVGPEDLRIDEHNAAVAL